MGSYDDWLTREPDPGEFDDRPDDEDRGSSLDPDRWPEPEDWDAAREAAEDAADRMAEECDR